MQFFDAVVRQADALGLLSDEHFTVDGEEEAVHITDVVPFLIEDELKRIGGLYEKAEDWERFAIVDGGVVTGQSPASSTAAVGRS